MITREDDVDIHALRRQGWTITAIANHVGRDRKTVRDYLNGKRDPGVRKRSLDPFAPFVVRDGALPPVRGHGVGFMPLVEA